jgi:uncharacterized membrane protein YphA (DoxX/SURF4 family)
METGLESVFLAFRFLLASVFIIAGVSKVRDRARLVKAIKDYRLLPERLATHVAFLLPRFEVVCGLLLLLGLAIPAVAAGVGGLALCFAGAVALNLIRGRRIECGCFGAATRSLIGWWTVARNLAIAGMSLAVALDPPLALAVPLLWTNTEAGRMSSTDGLAILALATVGLTAGLLLLEVIRLRRAINLTAETTRETYR